MSFFEANDGDFYPFAGVEYFTPERKTHDGKHIPARAFMKDRGFEAGGVHLDFGTDLERLIKAAMPCIPAQAGFTLLEYCAAFLPGDEDFVDEHPIIGWRTTLYGNLEPLIIESDYDGLKGNHGVLEPSGKVYDIHGSHYRDRAGWETEQRGAAQIDRTRAEIAQAEASGKVP